MATADSPTKPLQVAMKMAKVAIQLDGHDRHQEAYCQYLRTINFISQALLEEAGPPVLEEKEVLTSPMEVERMLRLAEQCLERARSFRGKTPDASTPDPHPPDASTPDPHPPDPPTPDPHPPDPHPLNPPTAATVSSSCPISPSEADHNAVFPAASTTNTDGGAASPFLPPDVFQRLQTAESQDGSRKELTPLEKASRLNQKLRASYEARLARLSPAQSYQKTSLTLSLQRQMMENLIIARARQETLQRKMEERRLRLQEQANRRFAASGAMTVEEQEQRRLYANVLEYEQDHDWPKEWKANIKENPNDVTLVSGLVSYLLSRSDHPVVKLLRKQQYQVYNKLYPIISRGTPPGPAPTPTPTPSHGALSPHLDTHPARSVSSGPSTGEASLTSNHHRKEREKLHTQVTVERENSFEDLEEFLTQLDWSPPDNSSTSHHRSDPETTNQLSAPSYPDEAHVSEIEMSALKKHLKDIVKDIQVAIDQLLSLCLLSFECLNIASSKYLTLTTIEEAFFMPLWNALMALFRKVNRDRELVFERSMKLHQETSPGDLGVPLKLFPPDPSDSRPYECAVQELKLLTKESCPQRKLECIVRTSRLICACAEDYRSLHDVDSAPTSAAIGADDLLPILSLVVLRCQSPQLLSECAALEEFIHEGYLIGEEGYCLTSMQSALAYLETLQPGGTGGNGSMLL